MATIIDLSHPLEHGQPNFPLDPQIRVVERGNIASLGYNITEISMSTHQGTHLDAPFHFYEDGMTVDKIPLDRLYGPASLVDFAPGSALEDKAPITLGMLLPHEEKFCEGAKVICRSGWDRAFGTPEFFADFPSFTVEAARWIAEKRIALLGMDMPTPGNEWQEIHWALLKPGVDIVVVEGLANLASLPDRFTFAAFPLKIQGRDGSPVRAVAILDTDDKPKKFLESLNTGEK